MPLLVKYNRFPPCPTSVKFSSNGVLISFVLLVLLLLSIIESVSNNSLTANAAGWKTGDILYDSGGIPLVYYGKEIGFQRNPVTISNFLISICDNFEKFKDPKKLEHLQNNANWLIVNSKHYGNYSLLEYGMPYSYNMTAPWRSALAQGLAVQALTESYEITHNATYLDATEPMLNSFYVEVKDGGITYKTMDSGWWYEEYADEGGKNPRVLNGMMWDMASLYYHYNYTGSKKSEFLFNQGLPALTKSLSSYDNNGSSYYDSLKTQSTDAYNRIHIGLLDKLYVLTGQPIFKQYRDKWEKYRESHETESGSVPQSHQIAGQTAFPPTPTSVNFYGKGMIAESSNFHQTIMWTSIRGDKGTIILKSPIGRSFVHASISPSNACSSSVSLCLLANVTDAKNIQALTIGDTAKFAIGTDNKIQTISLLSGVLAGFDIKVNLSKIWSDGSTSMANPASTYCIYHGGKLEIRTGSAGQSGICVFGSGSECEEWQYFMGVCHAARIPDSTNSSSKF